MSTERQKMLAGDLYDPFDPELVAGRERARDLCQDLNATREAQQEERRRILRDLFGQGRRHGLDAAAVLLRLRLEHRARRARLLQLQLRRPRRVLRPDRQLLRCSDPPCRSTRRCTRSTREQRRQQEYGKPIEIGSDVWVGGGAIILPGVRDRLRRRHRRRQRRHTGRSGSDVRGRQPMPRHTRNHGRLNPSPSTIFLLPSYLSVRTRRS